MGLTKKDIESVRLWSAPFVFMKTLVLVILQTLINTANWIVSNIIVAFSGVIFFYLAYHWLQETDGDHQEIRHWILTNGSFILYWVVLGVLSSIGLGSGLHTFVLFLGPHIVKVARHALEHRTVAFDDTIMSYFSKPAAFSAEELGKALEPQYRSNPFLTTDAHELEGQPGYVVFFAILWKVAPAAFLWGLGTALGELPPYFIARAARKSGEMLEELEEIEEIEHDLESRRSKAPKHGIVDRAKAAVFEFVKEYGFIAILLAASIPNPLFDLAGLTCGHFGISFWTFFGATMIGKAIIKVSIQVLFIIFVLQWQNEVVSFIQVWLPTSIGNAVQRAISQVGEAKANSAASSSDGVVQMLWGYVLLAMIGYFIYTMIESAVHEYLAHQLAHQAQRTIETRHSTHTEQIHTTHVHATQVLSGIFNADDLGFIRTTSQQANVTSVSRKRSNSDVSNTSSSSQTRRRSPSPSARKPATTPASTAKKHSKEPASNKKKPGKTSNNNDDDKKRGRSPSPARQRAASTGSSQKPAARKTSSKSPAPPRARVAVAAKAAVVAKAAVAAVRGRSRSKSANQKPARPASKSSASSKPPKRTTRSTK